MIEIAWRDAGPRKAFIAAVAGDLDVTIGCLREAIGLVSVAIDTDRSAK